MLMCNYYIDYVSTSEKCLNANIPQIHYFKPKKEKDRKFTASFCRNQSTLLQLLHCVKKVKQFARECILKLFKIQNKRVYP